MNKQENDPDTLHMLDEANEEWVKLWTKPPTKLVKTCKKITFAIIPTEKISNKR